MLRFLGRPYGSLPTNDDPDGDDPPSRLSRRRRCCRCSFTAAAVVLVASSLFSLLTVHRWNQGFVRQEREAPLDHWASAVRKPWYARLCPDFSSATAAISSSPGATDSIPIWMISARPFSEVEPVVRSWTREGFEVRIVNTTEWSTNYVNTACQRKSFGSRLFWVYQRALSAILLLKNASSTAAPHPRSSHAVLLEDDALLVNGTALRQELAWAVARDLDYYSFFSVGDDNNDAAWKAPSCVYDHGMVAQVLSRRFAERLVNRVDRISFCRLPIDIWIAKHGPWYVTRRKLVQHVGTRLRLP